MTVTGWSGLGDTRHDSSGRVSPTVRTCLGSLPHTHLPPSLIPGVPTEILKRVETFVILYLLSSYL